MDRRAALGNLHRLEPRLVEETRRAMATAPRVLPPDMAFDAIGHALYARVTALPHFGMARAETELLRTCGREMLAKAGRPQEIVDLRAGAGVQVRPLLHDAMRYVAVERCPTVLADAVDGLRAAFPRLDVRGVVGGPDLGLSAIPRLHHPRLLVHLGGALGRMEPTDARLELSRVRAAMAPGDHLLIGMDLAKEPDRLRAAYDDAGGVFAAFARNALRHANREIGTDFRLPEWQPVVEVQADHSRVEVRLESRASQWVSGGRAGEGWRFEAGEPLVVERAHKPTEGQFAALALGAGFDVVETWSDAAQGFATFLLASATNRYLA